jgi:NADH dehydrogenase
MHDGEKIPAHTLLWAAGIQASGIVQSLGVELGSFRRAKVTDTLQLPDYPEVFAVGDAAHFEQDGRPLPTIAPVANQMADRAVQNILKLINNEQLETFSYKPVGSLAIIGRGDAVASMGSAQFSGFSAWVFWLVVHAIRLAGTRNRVSAAVSWFWEYFSCERGVRINTSPMVRMDN